jgi:dTDP-glucose 4,6-dehydratase
VADGLLFLLEKGKTGETYNIVGEEETVWTIADWIHRSVTGAELQDKDVKFIDFHSARPGHDRRYALSGEKLKKLGWEPPITLKKSVKKTVKWSLKHRDWL